MLLQACRETLGRFGFHSVDDIFQNNKLVESTGKPLALILTNVSLYCMKHLNTMSLRYLILHISQCLFLNGSLIFKVY